MKISTALLKKVHGGTSGGGDKTDPPDKQARMPTLGTGRVSGGGDKTEPPSFGETHP
jgi:hypothetical protein